MGLSITDQTFVHHMVCAKALSEAKTVEAYNLSLAKAKGSRAIKARDMEAVSARINKMNDTLSPLGFQFRTIFSPWENTVFWGLCNTLEDAAIPLSTILKKTENIAFFELIDILQFENGLIPLVVAHSKVAKKAGVPVLEAANLIQKLNQHKWLKVIKKQSGSVSVTFGARTLLEIPKIRSWLMTRNKELAAEPKEEDEEDDERVAELVPDEEIAPRNQQVARERRSSRRVLDDDNENGAMEIGPEEGSAEFFPDEEIAHRSQGVTRGRRSSRRVLDDDEQEDTMEIEPAPVPWRSKRARS